MTRQAFREARRMLTARSAQLRRNHFDDDPRSTCAECRLAYQVRAELEALRAIVQAPQHATTDRAACGHGRDCGCGAPLDPYPTGPER